MTLQNKTNQFFGSGTQKDDADVVDIFDQYGAGEDVGHITIDPVQSAHVPMTDNTPQNEFHDEYVAHEEQQEKKIAEEVVRRVPEVLPIVEEKTWERAMEKEDEKEVVGSNHVAQQEPVQQSLATPSVTAQQNATIPITPVQKMPEMQQQVVQEQKMDHVIEHVEDLQRNAIASTPVMAQEQQPERAVVQQEVQMNQKKSYLPSQQSTQESMQRIDPGKKTIAIVDDDDDTREMYATIFENADYNVIRAADGLEALSLFAEHTPHLIFTGVVMPRMDGFAMMEALKQNPRTADIPVVINSHLGRAGDKQRAEELGARDFIVRGFTPPRETLERIGALLLRSDYVFHFDATDPEARKLVKDLGASNFFVCPRGQEMVIKLNIVDPKELTFAARFSCVDIKK